RSIPAGERVTPNMDHYCLVLRPTDMHQLHAGLQAQGIPVEETVRPAWGAQGYGQQFKLWDPDGNKIELRSYTDAPGAQGPSVPLIAPLPRPRRCEEGRPCPASVRERRILARGERLAR